MEIGIKPPQKNEIINSNTIFSFIPSIEWCDGNRPLRVLRIINYFLNLSKTAPKSTEALQVLSSKV